MTNSLVILNNWLLIWGREEMGFPATVDTFMIFEMQRKLSVFLEISFFSCCNKSIELSKEENLHRQISTCKGVNSLTQLMQTVMRLKVLLELQQHWDGFFNFFFSITLSAWGKKLMLSANTGILKHIRKASVVQLPTLKEVFEGEETSLEYYCKQSVRIELFINPASSLYLTVCAKLPLFALYLPNSVKSPEFIR